MRESYGIRMCHGTLLSKQNCHLSSFSSPGPQVSSKHRWKASFCNTSRICLSTSATVSGPSCWDGRHTDRVSSSTGILCSTRVMLPTSPSPELKTALYFNTSVANVQESVYPLHFPLTVCFYRCFWHHIVHVSVHVNSCSLTLRAA